MRIVPGVVLALTLAGPVAAQQRQQQQEQQRTAPGVDEMAALTKDFADAFNTHDAAKVASFYADDGVLLSPGAAAVKGRAAIQAAFTKQLSAKPILMLTRLDSAITTTNLFVTTGTYSVTTPQANGVSQTLNAKYLTVFKRVGDGWKIAYDMHNADPP